MERGLIAVGPHQGRKVFTLQTLPGCEEPFDHRVGTLAGFSLHAGLAARADQSRKLERLCRYISRPAIAEQRQSLTPNANVRYPLKTPYRDGTTHVMLLRVSCSPPFGPACGCSKSLQAIWSASTLRLARPAAGRCGPSPVSRIPTSSRRS